MRVRARGVERRGSPRRKEQKEILRWNTREEKTERKAGVSSRGCCAVDFPAKGVHVTPHESRFRVDSFATIILYRCESRMVKEVPVGHLALYVLSSLDTVEFRGRGATKSSMINVRSQSSRTVVTGSLNAGIPIS